MRRRQGGVESIVCGVEPGFAPGDPTFSAITAAMAPGDIERPVSDYPKEPGRGMFRHPSHPR